MSSELNINRNIFLEKEELLRQQGFLRNDTIASIFLGNTTNWGVVRTDFVSAVSPDFLVEVGTNVGTIKIDNESKAVDKDGLLILQEAIDNISVPNDGNYYWVKISHKYRRHEVGYVSVNVDGELTGIDTIFTDVLRGQQTNVPTKIKFIKDDGTTPNNDQTYDIVDITDDLNCILNGDFVAESNLRYVVIGSTEFGESLTSLQLEGLYKYDSCNIELIQETVVDTPPTVDYIEDKQFYIARIVNNSNVIIIEDKRAGNYWVFNVEGVADKLSKDPVDWEFTVEQQEEARAKIGAVTSDEVESEFFGETSWLTMTRNASFIESTGFDVKIKRRGQNVQFMGIFTSTSSDPSAGDTLFSVPYSSIGLDAAPATRIYFQLNRGVDPYDANRGAFVYIDPPSGNETLLQVKVLSLRDFQGANYAFNFNYLAK